ncbi:MAG: ribosomal protein S8.e [Halorubrum sp. J07HR59]|nr:MAG: ribosomal protein S8.e [Halorubrum sp. J07HR59]
MKTCRRQGRTAKTDEVEQFKFTVTEDTHMTDQSRSTRKRTGGRRQTFRKKKRHELGRQPTETTVGEERIRTIDVRGNEEKTRALSTNIAQVADGGETVEAEIENVVENPANVNYVRRNIVTNGAIIETSEGRARVTSRPGQTGQVNAVKVE